ncbi:C-type lectin 37Db-like [Drosophila albomicans]|uniref:C-type lectin 37Db-like n=1 Tax=Drosophila albomicans TaxID=7291 RepID=A0A6P8X4G9_DROAB|nr:C-type lectin 37Db-like [Drosophila albomicans]
MKIVLKVLLIYLLLQIGNTQTCLESKKLDETCGSYCFKVVKQLLGHTNSLQKQVNGQESELKKETLERFANMEQQLRSLKEDIEKPKQNLNEETVKEFQKLYEKIGSKYYYIERQHKINWFAAVHKCHEHGSHLASIQNQQEFNALGPKLKGDHYWIDINDLGHKGVYRSHTTGQATPYFNWYNGEPNNNGHERCVALEERGQPTVQMNDQDCTALNLFVCELFEK